LGVVLELDNVKPKLSGLTSWYIVIPVSRVGRRASELLYTKCRVSILEVVSPRRVPVDPPISYTYYTRRCLPYRVCCLIPKQYVRLLEMLSGLEFSKVRLKVRIELPEVEPGRIPEAWIA